MRVYPDIKENNSSKISGEADDKAPPIAEKIAVGFSFISVFIFFLKILFF